MPVSPEHTIYQHMEIDPRSHPDKARIEYTPYPSLLMCGTRGSFRIQPQAHLRRCTLIQEYVGSLSVYCSYFISTFFFMINGLRPRVEEMSEQIGELEFAFQKPQTTNRKVEQVDACQ